MQNEMDVSFGSLKNAGISKLDALIILAFSQKMLVTFARVQHVLRSYCGLFAFLPSKDVQCSVRKAVLY